MIPTRQQAAMKEMEGAAATLGVKLDPLAVQVPDDFEGAIEAVVKDGADALMFLEDTLFFVNRARLRDFAAARRLPAMYPDRRYVEEGGLMAYGPSIYDQLRRTATTWIASSKAPGPPISRSSSP